MDPALPQFTKAQQQAILDICVAVSVLETRVMGASAWNLGYLVKRFSEETGLPVPLVSRVLKETGERLFNSDWEFFAAKQSEVLMCQFTPAEEKKKIVLN